MIKGSTDKVSSRVPVIDGSTYNCLLSARFPDLSVVTDDASLQSDRTLITGKFFWWQAGVYELTWTCDIIDETEDLSQIYKHVDRQLEVVTYIDVYRLLVIQLQLDIEEMPIGIFSPLFAGAMRYWLQMFAEPVPDYNAFSFKEGVIFDSAMVQIMSCMVRQYVSASMVQTGEVKSIGTGPDKMEFYQRILSSSTSESDNQCLDKAWMLFNTIPSISAWVDMQNNKMPFFKGASRRKSAARSDEYASLTAKSFYNDGMYDYLLYGGYLNGITS